MILESIVIKDTWFKKTESDPGVYHFYINEVEVTKEYYKSRLVNLGKQQNS